MNINIKMFLCLVGVTIIFSVLFILQPQSSEGWGAISQGIGFFFSVILISIIFGLFGSILSKEKKFLHALIWFAVSFLVLYASFQIVANWRQLEWQKTHSQNQISQVTK